MEILWLKAVPTHCVYYPFVGPAGAGNVTEPCHLLRALDPECFVPPMSFISVHGPSEAFLGCTL